MRTLLILLLILFNSSKSYQYSVETIEKTNIVKNNKTNHTYENCITELKRREGFRSTPYLDNDVLRIGYGSKFYGKSNINEKEADSLLNIDFQIKIKQTEKELSSYCLTEAQIYAIAMLTHNIGYYKFKYKDNGDYTNLYLQVINSKNPKHWLKYTYNKGKKSKNLIKARNYEYRLFISNKV